MTRAKVRIPWRLAVLALAVIASVDCKTSGSSSSGSRAFTISDLTISGNPWTDPDTTEGVGARDVPLLGLVITNTHPATEVILTDIHINGQGDLAAVSGLNLFDDADGDGKVSPGESILWAGGAFLAGSADATGLTIPIPPAMTTALLVTCDIRAGASVGEAFRAWIDGPGGDLGFSEGPATSPPRGRAGSGMRTVGTTGMASFGPRVPQRPAFADAGRSNLPSLAAHVRTTSVESLQDLVFDLVGTGTAPGWTEIRWSLWLDGDGDGAKLSPLDLPISTDMTLQPGVPSLVNWPGPIAPGDGVDLLLTADILAAAPPDGLYEVALALTGATGVLSGNPVTVVGMPVEGGIRVGTLGMVVTAGRDLAIQDPDFGVLLDSDPGPWAAFGGMGIDPQGEWVALGSTAPESIVLVSIRGLREIGRIQLLAAPDSLVVAPTRDKIYVSLGSLRGVAEVVLDPFFSGGTVSRYFLPGKISGELAIHPTGNPIYLAQPTGAVQIVDTTSGLATGAIDGPPPKAIELAPGGDPLLVVAIDDRLHSLSTTGGAPASTGRPGQDVAFAPDGSEIYLVNDNPGDEVQVLDPTSFFFLDFRPFTGPAKAITAGSWPGRVIVLAETGGIIVSDPGLLPVRAALPSPLDVWIIDVVR